jgi:ribose 5-phosphate isomerase A
MTSEQSSIAAGLEAMAREAAKHVRDGMVIGLGSGSAVRKFVEILSNSPKSTTSSLRFVPTSLQIQTRAEEIGLCILAQPEGEFLDLVVDGADQIDRKGTMIKGRGGALFKEKILLSSGKKNIILADDSKYVEYLSRSIPVEVAPFARLVAKYKLERLGGKPNLRVNDKGYPTMTENGNILYDVDFGRVKDPYGLEESLSAVPGVIENGIFTCRVHIYYKVSASGEVDVFSP